MACSLMLPGLTMAVAPMMTPTPQNDRTIKINQLQPITFQ
jgi:hypothetical protein